jgi:hypothetical protein
MGSNSNALEIIDGIEWFANAGTVSTNPRVDVVGSWDEAIASCSTPEWEMVTLEVRNELTMQLNRQCKDEFQKWNLIIDEINEELSDAWARLTKTAQNLELPKVVVDCARWDTMHAAASEYYRSWHAISLYTDLLVLYADGHFPCGWKGTWPSGKLCVF